MHLTGPLRLALFSVSPLSTASGGGFGGSSGSIFGS